MLEWARFVRNSTAPPSTDGDVRIILYDDDDEGQARAGGKGAGDAASRNTSARAENTGAVENTEHATAQAIEGDDFFM